MSQSQRKTEYALAKRLKQSGFPRQWRESSVALKEKGEWLRKRVYTLPPLEELVVACIKHPNNPDNDFHLENIYGDNWGAAVCWKHEKDEWEHGYTPQEAVARLWLSIND